MPMRRSMSRSRISTRYVPSRNCRMNDWDLVPSTRSSVEYSTSGSVSRQGVHAERKSTQMAHRLERSHECAFFFLSATLTRTHIQSTSPCGWRQCLQALALHRNDE